MQGILLGFLIFALSGCFPGQNRRESRSVPGDAASFDPIAQYDAVREYAGEGAQLLEMSAFYVKSDGTVDLNAAYDPYVSYEFFRLSTSEGQEAPPLGAGGSGSDQWYQTVTVEAWRPGKTWSIQSGSSNFTFTTQGLSREWDEPRNTMPGTAIDAPTCSFATLWQTAIQRDAPANAVAIIDYDGDGYSFRIRDTNISLDFGTNCGLER